MLGGDGARGEGACGEVAEVSGEEWEGVSLRKAPKYALMNVAIEKVKREE